MNLNDLDNLKMGQLDNPSKNKNKSEKQNYIIIILIGTIGCFIAGVLKVLGIF